VTPSLLVSPQSFESLPASPQAAPSPPPTGLSADRQVGARLEAVVHDFKTPLTSLIGFASLLLQEAAGPLTPLQRRLLSTLLREGERLSDQLERALRGPLGTLDDRSSLSTDLSAVLDQVIARLSALDAVGTLRVQRRLAAELPAVGIDAEALALVLTNLIDNARGFNPPSADVEIEVQVAAGQLQVSVLDSGPGLANQDLERVFDRFYRGASQPAERPGNGLGLAICRQILADHGGRIWAQNRPTGGACLSFTLPLSIAS
jgi:two-component system, OmpR family, sensor histidine kinase KdpD